MTAVFVALIAAAATVVAGYVGQRVVKRRAPEDRDSIIAETTRTMQEVWQADMERLLAKLGERDARIKVLEVRVGKLEAALAAAGIPPESINGG